MAIRSDLLCLAAAVGLPLTWSLWYFLRGMVRHPRLWRLAACASAGVCLTPTVCIVCGARTMLPAISIALNAISNDPVTCLLGLVYGVLPMVATTGLTFSLWSYYVERRRAAKPCAASREAHSIPTP